MHKIFYLKKNHEMRPETESWNSEDHELWNHEMRGSPVKHCNFDVVTKENQVTISKNLVRNWRKI